MAFIDETGRLFGKWHVVDCGVLVLGFFVATGIWAVQSGWHQTASQVNEGEADIQYAVYMRNIKTRTPEALFHVGESVHLTIRNQPRGDVKVVSVNHKPKSMMVPTGGGGYKLIADPDDQFGHDFVVVLQDHAVKAPDSYVTNGIKVKTGMTLLVEGFDFKLNGVIMDIHPVAADKSAAAH